MTCSKCKDRRWVKRKNLPGSLAPCPLCNDNGSRAMNDPDPSLKEIVATLPKGHAAVAEYKKLVKCTSKK